MRVIVELLIDIRAEIVQRRVSPASIVEAFDVEEKVGLGLVAGVILAVMHQFSDRPSQTPQSSSIATSAPTSRLCHLAGSLIDIPAKWTQSVVMPNVVYH